ncbi:unnamed protein product [Pleuronectes platessa]|uniref:Uncharacterized protein n=1 Tax=Pleuronectes platessa TaxID=8262 RepID=A0A9N7V4K9_PLEPL|nr:unnamed protein product [Pleuronectes platessa]
MVTEKKERGDEGKERQQLRPGPRATSPAAWSQYLNHRGGTLGSEGVRLPVHRSTASTHIAKGTKRPLSALSHLHPRLPDTPGQTVAGPSRCALLGDSEADTEADWEVH